MYKARAKKRIFQREFERAVSEALPLLVIIGGIILFYSIK